MAKLSAETIRARLLVLGHARAWMLDQVTGQASSDILLDENEESCFFIWSRWHGFYM